MKTEFRPATEADLPAILQVIAQAREFLRQQGLDQWQNGYPSEDILRQDIQNGESFVLLTNGELAATAAVLLRDEPDYARIYEGEWGGSPAAAMHRVAMAQQQRGSGLGGLLVQGVKQHCLQGGFHWLRIDTHPGNLPMQRFLVKNGFVRRGVIYLQSGSEAGAKRLAFDARF